MDRKTIQESIASYFDYGITFDIEDLLVDVIDRIDFDEINEDNMIDLINDAIDSGLIYYKDQWTMLQFYCTPLDANWNVALEKFFDDVYGIVSNLMN